MSEASRAGEPGSDGASERILSSGLWMIWTG